MSAAEPDQHAASFDGAVEPDRGYSIDAAGVRIALHEWGEQSAPPLLMAHGGFDFARTFDTFAPLLADAGWRVVSWDQRGHGDSAHTQLYSWEADLRDAALVFDHVAGRTPIPVLGHSKGGAMMIQLADAEPFRFAALVNIDGMPSRHPVPDVAEHERTRMLASEVTGWLDHRARTAGSVRRPGTIDELATRRGRMNPRLSHEWLRYLVTVGATQDDDGWRWKLDPSMRFGGFGPWRPQWSLLRMAGIGVPFFGMLVGIEEEMGWKTRPDELGPYLPERARLDVLDDLGHFAHIERPAEIADRVLEFFDGALR